MAAVVAAGAEGEPAFELALVALLLGEDGAAVFDVPVVAFAAAFPLAPVAPLSRAFSLGALPPFAASRFLFSRALSLCLVGDASLLGVDPSASRCEELSVCDEGATD